VSKEALTKVVQRAISDPAFRRQLASDASGALRGYDLTADEIGAMQARDAAKLTAFGVDVRMSKVFTLDPGTTGAATLTSGSEPRDVAPVWIGDGSQALSAQTSGSEPRDVAPVWIGDGSSLPTGSEPRDVAPVWIGDGSQVLHTYSGDDNAGPEGALSTGTEPRDIAPVWIGDGSTTSDGYATDEGQLTNDSPGADIHITTGDGDLDQ
jgi:hypothetical protein